MEFKKELGHLNLQELATALDIPFDVLLATILRKNALVAKEFPIIVQYGDLAQVGRQVYKAASTLIELLKENANVDGSVSETAKNLLYTFEFISDVLMEKNVSQEFIEKRFLNKK